MVAFIHRILCLWQIGRLNAPNGNPKRVDRTRSCALAPTIKSYIVPRACSNEHSKIMMHLHTRIGKGCITERRKDTEHRTPPISALGLQQLIPDVRRHIEYHMGRALESELRCRNIN
eukprot:9378746-Pyramimonas_sp.AAC.1